MPGDTNGFSDHPVPRDARWGRLILRFGPGTQSCLTCSGQQGETSPCLQEAGLDSPPSSAVDIWRGWAIVVPWGQDGQTETAHQLWVGDRRHLLVQSWLVSRNVQTWAEWPRAGAGRAGRRLPCVCLSPRTPPGAKRPLFSFLLQLPRRKSSSGE